MADNRDKRIEDLRSKLVKTEVKIYKAATKDMTDHQIRQHIQERRDI